MHGANRLGTNSLVDIIVFGRRGGKALREYAKRASLTSLPADPEGAAKEKGIVVGILPGPLADVANPHVTIPIATNLGNARNAIIAQSADFIIAIGKGFGTLSEIALALQNKKKVYGLGSWEIEGILSLPSVAEVIEKIKKELESSQLEPSAANLSKVFQGNRFV